MLTTSLPSTRLLCAVACLLLGLFPVTRAQDTAAYTTLHNFTGNDGVGSGNLVEGSDGNFYGTNSGGGFGYMVGVGSTGNGTVFRITPTGVLTTIHVFDDASEGQHPYGLIKGRDGNFYGQTDNVFANNATVFRITPEGQLTTIYSSKTSVANGPLAQDDSGDFYGVSYADSVFGSIFRLTPAGVYTILYTFTGGDDGAADSALTRGSDGNFYGTGGVGGRYDSGTIYQITPAGAFKTLYTFTGGADGFLADGLTLGRDGNLYGTAEGGGANNYGVVFRVTNAGDFTVLYSFTGGSDSSVPIYNLVLGLDGNLYGVTGGDTLPEAMSFRRTVQPSAITIPPTPPAPRVIVHLSTVFRITPAGALTTLYASDTTIGDFIQGSDGSFYGADDDVVNDTSSLFKLTVVPHPAFFTGQAPLSDGVDYLAFPNGNIFGYYTFLSDPNYLYHFDLGYEYLFDAKDSQGGIYLYDFASSDFFYTSPTFPFPYLYDFNLKSVLYYYPDPNNPGRYNTDGVRYFYDYATGQIITK